MNHSQKRLHQFLAGEKIDGFFITKKENIFWLTGFNGSFGLFLQKKDGDNFLITDARYIKHVETLAQKNNFTPFLLTEKNKKSLSSFLKLKTNETSFFVENDLTLRKLDWLNTLFPEVSFLPQDMVLETLRQQKNETEIEKLKSAQNQVDSVLLPFLKSNLKTDITEKELAFKLEIAFRGNGKFDLSFPIIVAFGKNSAIPHHEPSSQKLTSGENILIDCGVKFDGFCSDMTRNFVFGKVDQEFLQSYCKLLKIQKKCLNQFVPNKKISNIEIFCRKELGTLEPFFTHSLGHGVGLEIHEEPRISTQSEKYLQKNEIVTCEPGIYFPQKFGIRIEDTLIVRDKKPEILTKTTKDLLRIDEEVIIKKLN